MLTEVVLLTSCSLQNGFTKYSKWYSAFSVARISKLDEHMFVEYWLLC